MTLWASPAQMQPPVSRQKHNATLPVAMPGGAENRTNGGHRLFGTGTSALVRLVPPEESLMVMIDGARGA